MTAYRLILTPESSELDHGSSLLPQLSTADDVSHFSEERLVEASEQSRSNLDDDFDDEDRECGSRVRMIVALSVLKAVFGLGCELSRVFHKFEHLHQTRGRASKYGNWLKTYLPTFERKTLDRWRIAYEKFAPLVGEEMQTPCLDYFNAFELSSIYALCRNSVTDDHRLCAMEKAKSGEAIDKRVLAKILPTKSDHSTALYRKHFSLPAGNITITINHDDFRQALTEAIWEIDNPPSSNSQSTIASTGSRRSARV
jgi:hypothetical protein